MRECFIIERRGGGPDGCCDARKYADRQLFKRSHCSLEYRQQLYRALLQYPSSSNANRVNYRLATVSAAPHYETDAANISISQDKKLEDNSQTSSPDEGNMECSQSNPKFVCSICGSTPMAIKIEERIEESTTSTYEVVEENNVENNCESLLNVYNDSRRVPFPEAGVDIIDRKLKNTQESFEKEIDEYHTYEDEILTYTESWTENWLFRKKHTPSRDNKDTFKPVSMFVPNTTANYRAMIGDQNVDEISDLSECSNDSDDLEEFVRDEDDETTRRNGLAKYIYDQRSRVLLDGKSKHHCEYNIDEMDLEYKEAFKCYCYSLHNHNTNFIEEVDVRDEEKNVSRETFNVETLSTVANENSSNSVKSNRSYKTELFIETSDVNQNSLSDDKLSDIDFNLFSPPKPGTIADREHRKWQTAAPLKNNPYSEENLQKRLLNKKYTPKYSSASSLLGIARMNGLDDGMAVDTTQVVMSDIDFEKIDLPEKLSVNNTSIIETTNEDIVNNKSPEKTIRVKERKSNGMHDKNDTKNKSHKSKCTNSETIKVTKKNATINEVDYSSSDSHEEKISLPSVKKLVEVFSTYQRTRQIVQPKDKNSSSEPEINQVKFMRVERTQPRPLHLHSLTARSLSKEFREGLR